MMIASTSISLPAMPFTRFTLELEYRYLVGVASVVALFMDIMDSRVVNVALPRIGQELHATTSMLEWVASGCLFSLAVWISSLEPMRSLRLHP